MIAFRPAFHDTPRVSTAAIAGLAFGVAKLASQVGALPDVEYESREWTDPVLVPPDAR